MFHRLSIKENGCSLPWPVLYVSVSRVSFPLRLSVLLSLSHGSPASGWQDNSRLLHGAPLVWPGHRRRPHSGLSFRLYCYSCLSLRFLAYHFSFLISTMVPFAPGTAPITSRRFCSAFTSTTSMFFTVTRSDPICPGSFWFFHTLEGYELAPIEPGARLERGSV